MMYSNSYGAITSNFRPERVLFRPWIVFRGRPRRASSYLTVSRGGTNVRIRATPRFPCQDERYLLPEQKPRGAWSSYPWFPDGHQVKELTPRRFQREPDTQALMAEPGDLEISLDAFPGQKRVFSWKSDYALRCTLLQLPQLSSDLTNEELKSSTGPNH